MLMRMKRLRLTAVALLGLASVLWLACATKQQNGAECLKSSDCESERCIQFVCYNPAESKIALPDTGTVAVDAGSDTPVIADTGPETATTSMDTGDNDTGSDTATAD